MNATSERVMRGAEAAGRRGKRLDGSLRFLASGEKPRLEGKSGRIAGGIRGPQETFGLFHDLRLVERRAYVRQSTKACVAGKLAATVGTAQSIARASGP